MPSAPRRFGRYQILGAIGRGGMAEVFLAQAPGAEGVTKRLALKRIRPNLVQRPGFLDLFVIEARIAVELSHANIVPVFDFGRIEDAYFLAMEYVEGRDLGALLERARKTGRPLSPALVAFVAAEVASALDYAHRRDVVHRDVAPRNVLVSTEGEVRLSDFGVALRGDDPGGVLRGTLTYMAPEQARGEDVDGRADLFALGMVMIEALSCRKPRDPMDPKVALAQARAAEVPALPPDTPPGLAAIVRRATEVEAAARYTSARKMLEDLEAYLRGEHVTARTLADELVEQFGEQPAAPVDVVPDEFEDVTGSAQATYLGGEVTTVAWRPKARRGLAWAVAGTSMLLMLGLLWWRMPGKPGAPGPAPPRPAGSDSPAPAPVPPAPAAAPTADASVQQKARPARGGEGTLDLIADPWAYVEIEGRDLGQTPLLGLRLRAGTHHVRLRNPHLHVDKEIVVRIKAGGTTKESVKLSP